MARHVVIVGGGLSGLAVLHALAVRYAGRGDIQLRLLEQSDRVGGTIRTEVRGGRLFEWGPNGFLDSRASCLDLIAELGLNDQLIPSDRQAADRFISVGGRWHPLPTGLAAMLRFAPMSLREKMRILAEPFIPRGLNPNETVYEFGCRRLGAGFARCFLDPMVSGIFAGDACSLVLKSAFPRIHEIEQTYGSLIRGMVRLRRERKTAARAGQPAGELRSLRRGMGQLIDELSRRYAQVIHCGEPVMHIGRAGGGLGVETPRGKYLADALFVCSPAYAAGPMLESLDVELARGLAAIPYAPLAVVGLVYPLSFFTSRPRGFGCLIPSAERKPVLGVLLDSNIFPGRSADDEVLLRVMIGGARHPDVLSRTDAQLIQLAESEIHAAWGLTGKPSDVFLSRWPRAIPQYDRGYENLKKAIFGRVRRHPGLYLAANYIGGISMNDCAKNARELVGQLDW